MVYVTVYWAYFVLEIGFHLEKQALKSRHISEAASNWLKSCIFHLTIIRGWYINIQISPDFMGAMLLSHLSLVLK